MVNQSIFCDRCKALVTEGRSLLTTTAGPLLAWRPSIDLCRDCSSALVNHFLAGDPIDRNLAQFGPDPFLDGQIAPLPAPLGVSA